MHVGTVISCDISDRPVADPILSKFYIYNIIIGLAISALDEKKKINNKIIILIMRYALRVLCARARVFGIRPNDCSVIGI